MVQKVTPKRLQRERKSGEALEGFTAKYVASLEEKDRFLSAIYMDEILQTILLESKPDERQEPALRRKLDQLKQRIPEQAVDDFQDDIEIAVRKRFPERYGVEKGKAENESA